MISGIFWKENFACTVKSRFVNIRLIRTLVITDSFLGHAPYFFLKISALNKDTL